LNRDSVLFVKRRHQTKYGKFGYEMSQEERRNNGGESIWRTYRNNRPHLQNSQHFKTLLQRQVLAYNLDRNNKPFLMASMLNSAWWIVQAYCALKQKVDSPFHY